MSLKINIFLFFFTSEEELRHKIGEPDAHDGGVAQERRGGERALRVEGLHVEAAREQEDVHQPRKGPHPPGGRKKLPSESFAY